MSGCGARHGGVAPAGRRGPRSDRRLVVGGWLGSTTGGAARVRARRAAETSPYAVGPAEIAAIEPARRIRRSWRSMPRPRGRSSRARALALSRDAEARGARLRRGTGAGLRERGGRGLAWKRGKARPGRRGGGRGRCRHAEPCDRRGRGAAGRRRRACSRIRGDVRRCCDIGPPRSCTCARPRRARRDRGRLRRCDPGRTRSHPAICWSRPKRCRAVRPAWS